MNTEEIMVNEEVMDLVEDTAMNTNSGRIVKTIGIAALTGVVGYIGYRLAKKAIAAIREKKAQKEHVIDITQEDIDAIVNDEL